jgi:DNA polymerase
MFIGEGPGQQEDIFGVPFVGRAGELLTKIIQAMGMTRDEVYIGNAVKCRPPGNRAPEPVEMNACFPYLRRQIQLIQPEVIVILGATAWKALFGPQDYGLGRIRGTWLEWEGIPVMPTWHPVYLLRTPSAKRETWNDIKEVMNLLERNKPSYMKDETDQQGAG